MSILAIPSVISNAISSLTSNHAHKKGVHGDKPDAALNGGSGASAAGGTQSSGSTQSLFGTLLDSVEQIVGIQTPAAAEKSPSMAAAVQQSSARLKA